MKKHLLFIAAIVFMYSCGNQNTETEGNEASIMQAHELMAEWDKHVGEEVKVKGTAVHICEHGGKRMFLVSDTTNDRLKVTAGDKIGSFKQEDAGSNVIVTGVVKEKKLDETYLNNWEEEIRSEHGEPEHKVHEGDHGEDETHEDHDIETELAKVNQMRKKIEESDKDYLSFYSIEAKSYEKE